MLVSISATGLRVDSFVVVGTTFGATFSIHFQEESTPQN